MSRSSSDSEMQGADVKAASELEVDDTGVLMGLCGPQNERLRAIERELGLEVGLRGHTIFLRGGVEAVAVAERFLAEAATLYRQGVRVENNDVARALRILKREPHVRLRDMFDDVVTVGSGKKPIGPRGVAQK